jgi:hypothetical protein
MSARLSALAGIVAIEHRYIIRYMNRVGYTISSYRDTSMSIESIRSVRSVRLAS